jgi:hypothetical protein
VLEKFIEKGEILRVAQGIYAHLEKKPILGELKPTLNKNP